MPKFTHQGARRLLENGNYGTGFYIFYPSSCWSLVILKKKKKKIMFPFKQVVCSGYRGRRTDWVSINIHLSVKQ